TDVVVVPMTEAPAQVLQGEAAAPIGRGGREWGHLRGPHREDVAVRREEVPLPLALLLELLAEAVVEDLHLDAAPRQRAGLDSLEPLLRGPDEDPGVPARAEVAPLRPQLEVGQRLLRPDHAHRAARAVDHAVLPAPRAGLAVDVREVGLAQLLPAP